MHNITCYVYYIFLNIGLPKFTENPPELSVVRVGENITFICSATAVPVPVITWSRLTYNNQSEQLSISSRNVVVEGNMLTLLNAQYYQDSGNYTCIASNRQGNNSATTALSIYGNNLCSYKV